MKATKNWGMCDCGCRKSIVTGDHFVIVKGEFFLAECKQKKQPVRRILKRPEN